MIFVWCIHMVLWRWGKGVVLLSNRGCSLETPYDRYLGKVSRWVTDGEYGNVYKEYHINV